MNDYVSVYQYVDNVGISFDVEAEKPFHVGEQMNAAHETAHMNGCKRRRAVWSGSTAMKSNGIDRP